jgi:hypothetical protein
MEDKAMYGYDFPRKLELGAIRVRISQSEIDAYRRRFPRLTRARILDAMIEKGPWRESVEAELKRMARELAACAEG